MPYPPTVLVDVDGTISDSLPGIVEGFRTALDAVGAVNPGPAFEATIAGPPMIDNFHRMGLDGDTATEALRIYRAQQRAGGWANTTMFDGWPGLLDGWRASGFRIVTATSKGGHFARLVLARFGILDRVDFIGAADDGGVRQDKRDVIAHTLRVLGLDDGPGVPRRGLVMVGDRSHDIGGAHAFGIPAVAVAWGYGTEDEWAEAEATAHDATALDRHVRRLLAMR